MGLVITASEIARLKLTPKDLQARFDKPEAELGEAEKLLVQRWRNRAQAGRDFCYRHYQTYLAIDRAWDANFYQSTQTLIGFLHELSLMEGAEHVESIAQKWNMTHLLVPEQDPKTGAGTGRRTINVPTMYSVIVSLGRAYTMARVSRLVNERVGTPFMKYEPAVSTDANKLFGDLTTQGIGVMNREMGHALDFKQAVQAAGKYGQQLMFIREDWYRQADYVNGPVIGKEGIRYMFPHPFRTYYDVSSPLRTLLSDTGCQFVGFWDMLPFGKIRTDPHLWNRDRIKRSTRSLDPTYQIFLQTTGGARITASPLSSSHFTGALDPVTHVENQYYSKSEDDQPVWVTEHFEKLNPKRDLDMADGPDAEFWFRVRLASDDTPIFVSCLPDVPAIPWLWEPDDQRVIQEGMLLQVIPFQDQLTNILTQANLMARQNLANLTIYNSDAIDKETYTRDIINPGELSLRKINHLGASFRNLEKLGIRGPGDVVLPIQFPKNPVNELILVAGQLLSLLERVTGMSAQEVGSYASHEQSAEEVRQIHTATSQRYEYIAGWIDDSFEAWKRQLYSYWISFGSLAVVAKVDPMYSQLAQQLGLTPNPDGTFSVPPEKVRVSGFIAQRDGPNRVPWAQIGGQMVQLLSTLAPILQGNPAEMFSLLNSGFEAMGLPRSFRLTPPDMATPDVKTYIQGEIEKLAQVVREYVDHKVSGDGQEKEVDDAHPMM